ncbi:hypothetical protein [Photobacterium damselae]|nr:hypothetical protein [Photobacterium damselae]
MLRNITIALGVGFIGSIANVFAIYLINPLQGLPLPDHTFIYKQSFLGRVMGIALLFAFFKTKVVYQRSHSRLYRKFMYLLFLSTIPVTPINIIKAFMVNIVVWGGCSSFFFYKATSS